MKIAPTAERVRYSTANSTITVERLQPEAVARRTAGHILGLVIAAYERQFEPGWFDERDDMPLQRSTVRQTYQSGGAVYEQHQKMLRRMQNGGAYWVVRAPIGGSAEVGDFVGLANTTPSRASQLQKFGIVPPNCYLGNVLAHPAEQNMGIGSAVMHAALKFGGYSPRRQVAADVLTDNPQGVAFFEHRGLQREEGVTVDPLELWDDQQLQQARFSGELGEVVAAMEAHVPMLGSVEVLA